MQPTAFNKKQMVLYLEIRQNFRLFGVFSEARPYLLTKLQLTHGHGKIYDKSDYAAVAARDPDVVDEARKYYIQSQEDFYQPDQFIKFVMPICPWLASDAIVLGQNIATFLCVLGVSTLQVLPSQNHLALWWHNHE